MRLSRRLGYLTIFITVCLFGFAFAYMKTENWGFADAMYLSAMTQGTVGSSQEISKRSTKTLITLQAISTLVLVLIIFWFSVAK